MVGGVVLNDSEAAEKNEEDHYTGRFPLTSSLACPAPNCIVEAHDGTKRPHTTSDAVLWSALKEMSDFPSRSPEKSIDEVLPEAMLMEILSRLPDAWDLANCAAVNSVFRSTYRHVKAVRFLYKREDLRRRRPTEPLIPFKDTVSETISHLPSVETLRLEIEDAMQASRYKDDEVDRHGLWLSQQSFVNQWLPPVRKTLQNLTVIDYGQQAIFHASPLLRLLAEGCKQLQTLELRNMYLDCRNLGENKMNKLTTLTLRCVKLTDTGLSDVNKCMPNLETLTLVTVVGLREADFTSDKLKVLCLGLATKVESVKLLVNSLTKLQLKMACPDKLTVDAPALDCLAVCMDKKDKTKVEFQNVKLLKELLMGASEFSTLTTLSASNSLLEKVFLDVPCMAFEDSGVWKGRLQNVPLAIPNMDAVRRGCPNLQTLSIGPGLWYALEDESMRNPGVVLKWPTLRRLIVHLIVQNMDKSTGLLTALVRALPTLSMLEVYVHTDSKVESQDFSRLKGQFPMLELKCDSWKKGLRFECFSF